MIAPWSKFTSNIEDDLKDHPENHDSTGDNNRKVYQDTFTRGYKYRFDYVIHSKMDLTKQMRFQAL